MGSVTQQARNMTAGSTMSDLTRRFHQALQSREEALADSTLHAYVDRFLERKEAFLQSCSRFGTPQYFFDEPTLIARIAQFKETFARHLPNSRIFYALKSNSCPAVCRRAILDGLGLDVSSGSELSLALELGAKEIVFSGPGKTDEELMLAIANRGRVMLLVDSFGEFARISEKLQANARECGPLRAGIRVHDGANWDKFGIPLSDLPKFFRDAQDAKRIRLCGIQFHTSWNLNPASQTHMIDKIGACIRRLISRDLWTDLSFVDIGGGFWPEQGEWLNPRNTLAGRLMEILDPGDGLGQEHYHKQAHSLDHFAREIAAAFSRQGAPLKDLDVWAEPGRWISTMAMHILLRVLDKKSLRSVITDGGTNLLGWERPLSEFIPVINLTRPSHEEKKMRVYGSLCTPLDIWGDSVFGEGIETGDILMVPDQGAYTYSLRQSFIKPIAKVVAYDGNTLKELEKEVVRTNGFSYQ